MEKAPPTSNGSTWLWRFAAFTGAATLGLIAMGGLVTSHGVGMAVPDWPTTYGYNMFLFPPSQWIGGIFYEHAHRLAGALVGLLTIILTVWLWVWARRNPRQKGVKILGGIALIGVVLQGVLGGLRVTLYKDEIGIVHATLAQMFLVLVCLIAWRLSPWWNRLPSEQSRTAWSNLRPWLLVAAGLVLAQLVLGAAMRHQHAGLAVPDFPLAYGKIWPPTDPETLAAINQARTDVRDFNPIKAFHIWLHLAHRFNGLLLVVLSGWVVWRAHRQPGAEGGSARLAFWWFAAIMSQAGLGAMTVWSNKAAEVATLHVVVGSGLLVLTSLMALFGCQAARSLGDAKAAPVAA